MELVLSIISIILSILCLARLEPEIVNVRRSLSRAKSEVSDLFKQKEAEVDKSVRQKGEELQTNLLRLQKDIHERSVYLADLIKKANVVTRLGTSQALKASMISEAEALLKEASHLTKNASVSAVSYNYAAADIQSKMASNARARAESLYNSAMSISTDT